MSVYKYGSLKFSQNLFVKLYEFSEGKEINKNLNDDNEGIILLYFINI